MTIKPVFVNSEVDAIAKQKMEAIITSSIVKTSGYIAIERNNEFLKAIANEIDYQLNGDVPTDQIAKVGAQYGAQYIVMVNIVWRYSTTMDYYISAKMIDVETAQIVASEEMTEANSSTIEYIGMYISDGLFISHQYPNLIDNVVVGGYLYQASDISDGLINHPNRDMEMITDPRIVTYIMREFDKRDKYVYCVMYSWDKIKRTNQISRKKCETKITYTISTICRNEFAGHFRVYESSDSVSEEYLNEKQIKNESFLKPIRIFYCPSDMLNK